MNESSYTDAAGLSTIAQLRNFEGSPKEFWPLFLRCVCEVTGATRATLGVKVSTQSQSDGEIVESWRALLSHPSGGSRLPDQNILVLALAEGIAREGDFLAFSIGSVEVGEGVVALENCPDQESSSLSTKIALLVSLPEAWQSFRSTQILHERMEGLTGALDLGLVSSAQKGFTAGSFAVCNEVAARMGCDRVSLGWQDDTAMKLRAISQADKFDNRSAIVRQVEAAMEETFDQDESLSHPQSQDTDSIIREHAEYAREAAVPYLCSIPLRSDGKPCGVWMLERSDKPFTEDDLTLLRVMADQVGPRLADLRAKDRPWPVRLWRKLKEWGSRFLGTRHTGPKLAGVGAALIILFLIFGRMPYTVEAPAVIRSGHVVFVTAPFDGFIEEALFEVGDTAEKGRRLVTFDTEEFLVQQAAELANMNRYSKEVERARADNALADMRVAEAQLEQAAAVLERTRYQIDQSEIEAPIDGVIVEGDLRKRLGAPVRKGDILFQQASLDELYVQVDVPEREAHEIVDRNEARMLFAAQPDEVYPLTIERIQPVGIPTQTGVVFQLRAQSADSYPDWWRPGMSGTVKIDVGWRNAGWILTHQTSDWLRRQLWW